MHPHDLCIWQFCVQHINCMCVCLNASDNPIYSPLQMSHHDHFMANQSKYKLSQCFVIPIGQGDNSNVSIYDFVSSHCLACASNSEEQSFSLWVKERRTGCRISHILVKDADSWCGLRRIVEVFVLSLAHMHIHKMKQTKCWSYLCNKVKQIRSDIVTCAM